MCKSKAQGGQRCFTHAQTALRTAETRRDVALAALDAAPAGSAAAAEAATRAQEARTAVDERRVEFASTRQGREALQAHLAEQEPGSVKALAIARLIGHGDTLRERNARDAARAAGKPTPPTPLTRAIAQIVKAHPDVTRDEVTAPWAVTSSSMPSPSTRQPATLDRAAPR